MHFSRPRRTGPGQPSPLLPPTCGGARLLDATPRQTCPRPRPRAQIAFKNSMIHGILQFTLSIAFRYVLHRNESRDIRCRESFHVVYRQSPPPTRRSATATNRKIPRRICCVCTTISIGDEPHARQVRSAPGGMDGLRREHRSRSQSGALKKRSSGGLGWPTQQLALRFIHPSTASRSNQAED